MRMVITPATRAVAAATRARFGALPPPRKRPVLSAWVPMISGFSTTMYAIVKNVARPPRTSRLTLEPRAEMAKKRSSALVGGAVAGPPTAVAPSVETTFGELFDDMRASRGTEGAGFVRGTTGPDGDGDGAADAPTMVPDLRGLGPSTAGGVRGLAVWGRGGALLQAGSVLLPAGRGPRPRRPRVRAWTAP